MEGILTWNKTKKDYKYTSSMIVGYSYSDAHEKARNMEPFSMKKINKIYSMTIDDATSTKFRKKIHLHNFTLSKLPVDPLNHIFDRYHNFTLAGILVCIFYLCHRALHVQISSCWNLKAICILGSVYIKLSVVATHLRIYPLKGLYVASLPKWYTVITMYDRTCWLSFHRLAIIM